MALTSPGVQVSVIDESFYTPAEPGTRPLVIVASAANKRNAAGTGTAQGTLAANAGKVYTVTSQRELADLFGDPVFRVDNNNNPIHAGELNEYGLQAAYSFLGVANSVLVARADLDLNALEPQAEAPGGEPQDGTFWLDTSTTTWGMFEWNGASVNDSRTGQSFGSKTPLIILDPSQLTANGPLSSVGRVGDYAVATGVESTAHVISMFYKNKENTWVVLGSTEWYQSWPVLTGNNIAGAGTGTFKINGTDITISGTTISAIIGEINNQAPAGVIAKSSGNRIELYSDGSVDSITIASVSEGIALSALGLTAGTFYAPALQISKHTVVPQWKTRSATPRPTGSVWIKTTEPNGGARWRLKVYNGNTKVWQPVEAPLFESSSAALAELDRTGGGINLAVNSAYTQYDFEMGDLVQAKFRVQRRRASGPTTIRSKVIDANTLIPADEYIVNMAESIAGNPSMLTSGDYAPAKQVVIDLTAELTAVEQANAIADAINLALFENISASVSADNRVVITHVLGGEIKFADDDGLGNAGTTFVGTYLGLDSNINVYAAAVGDTAYKYVASNWVAMTITPDTPTAIRQSYYISNNDPQTLVADGTLWYSSVVDEVDIMVNDGSTWVGYRNYAHDGETEGATDSLGPIVSASEPTSRPDGANAFVTGDLWIDTSDIDNYPMIKRYDADLQKWILIDKSDQTTENGIVFADARLGTSGGTATTAPTGTIQELLTSDFLDFDAPDPALYPRGMLLWNLRRSGFNVKKFKKNYVNVLDNNIRMGDVSMGNYYPHRWVTESANQADGSGSFGRHAQRKVVLQSLQALVNSNQEIRDTERNGFNLLACPGYPELIGEMISLNYDRGLTAFVVGDTPARLTPDATTINNWGTNAALALEDNEKGLVSSDEYLGVFYPWGFTSDNAGRDIIIPPSHMILRMIALSDQVSFPWFAPAGTRRGGITNATAVGYLNSEGEFTSVALNEGQRDTLYNVKVNPITFFVGSGLVNFGQKTRARNASALDRINVARLVIYLRSQLNKLAKPYIFEPNDKITRDEIKQQVESLLLELVGQRALYDFLVVCDESNNTPNRIDRNELYVDIAIEPVKAVEFIYIPVRLKNTGEIAGL